MASRTTISLGTLALGAFALVLGGCGGDDSGVDAGVAVDATVSDAANSHDGPAVPDARPGLDAEQADATQASDATYPCDEPATTTNPGSHNDGAACLSCHASHDPATRWTVAGTLYTNAAGTARVAGATIHVIDSTAKEISLVTALDGAFWTTESITPPLTVYASKCPDVAVMPSSPGVGDCNSCHSAGSRVHLP